MKILGNILWLIFGGLEAAIGYLTGSLALALTLVGLPWALQTFKLGLLCLWPFGSQVTAGSGSGGCLALLLNVVWLIFGGFLAFLWHVVCGLLLCLTIIGLPWGRQHFKLAGLALSPFGKEIRLAC